MAMIICPECGQQAPDETKFCDRCGQGLTATERMPTIAPLEPLAPGVVLTHGYRIVALLRQTSYENRYRAERIGNSAVVELRERSGPAEHAITSESSDDLEVPAPSTDSAGPLAKTAELHLRELVGNANGPPRQNAPGEDVPPQAAVAESAEPPGGPDKAAPAVPGEVEPAPAVAIVLSEPVASEVESSQAAAAGAQASLELAGALDGQPPTTAAESSDTSEQAEDLGEVYGRVLALSLTLKHPAFQSAIAGFAEEGRVYLVYPEEKLEPLAERPGGMRMEESEALGVVIQLCQAVGFVHRRGLRVNDICPASVAFGTDGRIRLTGLDYISNDNELQAEPVLNDGYTAPEIYRGKQADKRADIFAIGALLYTCLTGERLEAESWREEAGSVKFYPPHVVTPALEQAVRRALLFEPAARWTNVEAFKTELVRLSGDIRVYAAGLTDVGMVRELNEDAVMMLQYWRDSQVASAESFLYVIADGMGGAEAGEVASAIAVGAIRERVESRLGGNTTGALAPLLQEALEAANRQILDHAAAHPEARGMGSTAVGALVIPPDLAIAWVGDSRAYLSQETGLRQLSKDHSLVQRLIEIGQITPEQARHHEHKNVITRSLGARPNGPAGAETATVRLKRGDRLLLCSDGLTAHVEDTAIASIMRRHRDPDAAARELVAAANAGGGTDNISVVVMFAS